MVGEGGRRSARARAAGGQGARTGHWGNERGVAGRLTCESPRIAGHRIARAAHGSDDAARPSFALSAARSPLPSRSWTTSLPFASLSDGTSSCTFPGVSGRLRPLIVRRSCSSFAAAAAASAASAAATSSAERVGLAAYLAEVGSGPARRAAAAMARVAPRRAARARERAHSRPHPHGRRSSC